jgi:predicted nucleic acid-binding protein
VIAVDTSVVVRYLVGSPAGPARRARRLLDGRTEVGLPLVALVECAHVLRTQYDVPQLPLIGLLIELLQKRNVTLLGLRNEAAVDALVRARSLSGRPIPDALIVATAREHGALPLTTFDAGMGRYGIPVAAPPG